MTETKRARLKDLQPDKHNANKGTQRGLRVLDDSLRQLGAGRSILLDREGRIIAGNKTAERAADLGMEDVIVVETDGTQLVAVKRTDLDLENGDGRARKMAYYDNRAGELGLDWDADQLKLDLEDGLDLSGLWDEAELEQLPSEQTWAAALDGLSAEDKAPFQQMTFTLHDEQVETVKEALRAARELGPFVDTNNENGNGNALARICELWLGLL